MGHEKEVQKNIDAYPDYLNRLERAYEKGEEELIKILNKQKNK